jgi:hypothetical protein
MQQITVFIDLQDQLNHVSGNLLPIFRSVRLQITACDMLSCCSCGLAVRRAATYRYNKTDLGEQSILLFVASSWFFYITLPTLMMHGQAQIKLICRMCGTLEYIILRHLTRPVEWSGLMEAMQDIMNRPSIVAVHRDGGSMMANVVTSTLARLYLCSVSVL